MVLVSACSGISAACMECLHDAPFADDQSDCGRYDGGLLSADGGDLSGLYCMPDSFRRTTDILELFQAAGGLNAEITDANFERHYQSGTFPNLTQEVRQGL